MTLKLKNFSLSKPYLLKTSCKTFFYDVKFQKKHIVTSLYMRYPIYFVYYKSHINIVKHIIFNDTYLL